MAKRNLVARLSGPGFALGLALALLVLTGQAEVPAEPASVPGNPILDPAANSHTAPATTTVSITYDEPISPTTVTTRTFAVQARQTGLLMQTYVVSNGTISLVPSPAFHAGELVQVSATTATLSLLDGTGPISPTVWQFWTAVPYGSGLYTGTVSTLNYSLTWDIALGDVDGDGDLDAFAATVVSGMVWLNDGHGVFTDSGQRLGNLFSTDVEMGDLDGDGDLDAFVTNRDWFNTAPDDVWINQGGRQGATPGTFAHSGQGVGTSESKAVSVGDLDGDGDLDAFIANDMNEGNKVWLNEGDATFVDSGQSLGSASSMGVALGDLDGDGDLDAFVVNDGGNTVWLNDGQGTFVDSGQSLGIYYTEGVALGDLDGDGDLDAFVANEHLSPALPAPNEVWLNDGLGFFVESGQQLGEGWSADVALGDVDADGDIDACIANWDRTNEVWLNDGNGLFQDSGGGLGGGSWYAELGDVDGDGDLDAHVGDLGLRALPAAAGSGNRVWLNLSAPRARDDAYLTDKDTALHVPAPGVLANDRDPDSDLLVVSPLVPPTHGTVVLHRDGAVAYTPTLGFTGVDTFTYVVSDGALTATAAVELGVMATVTPPVLVHPANSALLSETMPVLTWRPSPDVTGYLLNWNGAVADVGGATHYTVIVTGDGTYTWTVASYDAFHTGPYTDTWSFDVDITPPQPPALSSPGDGEMVTGSTVTLTWQPSPSHDAAGYLLDWNGTVTDVGSARHYQVTGLADGSYLWSVAAYDAARNVGVYTGTWSFGVNSTRRIYLPLMVRSRS